MSYITSEHLRCFYSILPHCIEERLSSVAERGRDDYIWCALLTWDILEKISIAVLTLSGPDFSYK